MEEFIEQYSRLNKPAIVWVSHDPEQLRRVADREFRMEQHGLYEIVTVHRE
jgi:ABC-type iron transport system FetAB ATPase subunit